MPAEDDLTAIVEIERLINEAARTQPGSERVRLSKALEDAVGKVVRQPQQPGARSSKPCVPICCKSPGQLRAQVPGPGNLDTFMLRLPA